MNLRWLFKDYEAPTLEAAAAVMLRDPDVWGRKGVAGCEHGEACETGEQIGHTIDSWVWSEHDHALRVHFR